MVQLDAATKPCKPWIGGLRVMPFDLETPRRLCRAVFGATALLLATASCTSEPANEPVSRQSSAQIDAPRTDAQVIAIGSRTSGSGGYFVIYQVPGDGAGQVEWLGVRLTSAGESLDPFGFPLVSGAEGSLSAPSVTDVGGHWLVVYRSDQSFTTLTVSDGGVPGDPTPISAPCMGGSRQLASAGSHALLTDGSGHGLVLDASGAAVDCITITTAADFTYPPATITGGRMASDGSRFLVGYGSTSTGLGAPAQAHVFLLSETGERLASRLINEAISADPAEVSSIAFTGQTFAVFWWSTSPSSLGPIPRPRVARFTMAPAEAWTPGAGFGGTEDFRGPIYAFDGGFTIPGPAPDFSRSFWFGETQPITSVALLYKSPDATGLPGSARSLAADSHNLLVLASSEAAIGLRFDKDYARLDTEPIVLLRYPSDSGSGGGGATGLGGTPGLGGTAGDAGATDSGGGAAGAAGASGATSASGSAGLGASTSSGGTAGKPPKPGDGDDGGCAVAHGAGSSNANGFSLLSLALGLLVLGRTRRRRTV